MGLRQTALAIAIAIVFTVFVAYGLWAVYEPPKRYYEQSECWEQFDCEKNIRECNKKIYENQTELTRPMPVEDDCYRKEQSKPEYAQCRERLDDCEDQYRKTTQRYKHARNSFYILFVIALAALITGMLMQLPAISSGFITGGVLVMLWSLIYTAEYWLQWNKYVKLTALGVVLVLLVYLGYKKIETRISTKKKRK